MTKRTLMLAVLLGLLLLPVADLAAKKPAPAAADPDIVYADRWLLKVVDADGKNDTTIRREQGVFSPRWSRDGKHVVYMPNYYNIWRCDADGSNAFALVERDDSLGVLGNDVVWSPEGSEVAYTWGTGGSYANEIRLISAGGGTPQTVYSSPDGRMLHSLTFDATGERLAFVRTANGGEAMILDVATGATTVFYAMTSGDTSWENLDWARTKDVLALRDMVTGLLCTYDMESGSLMKLVPGRHPSWSPDDTQLVYDWGGLHVYSFATEVSEQITRRGGRADWKR